MGIISKNQRKYNSSKKKYIHFNKFIILFKSLIFILIFHNNICENSRFTYPKSITLLNGNIFIIHQDGIEIYDSSLTNKIETIKSFNENEKITTQNYLEKITISRFNENDNGLIICIIINKIYIFAFNGEQLYEENNSDIINIFQGNFYDLTPIKRDGDKYIYSVGFINNDKYVSLNYFSYDNKERTNVYIQSTPPFAYESGTQIYKINNYGISCQLMIDSENIEKLICFVNIHLDNQIISLASINLDNYSLINIGTPFFGMTDVKGIKSAVTQDKKKSLICMNFSSGPGFCTIYSIIDNNFTEIQNYDVFCNSYLFSSCLEFFRETEQFVFSCSNNDGKITATTFDKNLKNLATYEIIQGSQVSSSSIVYSYDLGNYIAISDIKSNTEGDKTFVEISSINKTAPVVGKLEELKPETTIPTTIPRLITTTMFSTLIKITSTLLIPEKTSIIKNLPKTIITTIIVEDKIIKTTIPKISTTNLNILPSTYQCQIEKCKNCDEYSASKNLCIECNNEKNYYEISPFINIYQKGIIFDKYKDCYNNITKPSNFYLNKTSKYYEPCYKTCATCEYNGDGNENNCTTCDVDHTKDPKNPNSKNCVALCSYFYYYTSYGQYKCSSTPQCPEENSLLIRDKRECVESCLNEDIYKYQYNGECLKECPEDTYKEDQLCKVKNKESCTQSSSEFELYNFLKEGGVEKIAKTYAKEFNYTNNHISLFKNEVYSIMLYKNRECINELGLSMPDIDFGECYKKVQNKFEIYLDLVVAIIDKRSDKKSNPITSYAFYNPENGDKLDAEQACKEEVIIVKENIKSLLNESVSDIDSILYLAGQNIDIFNKSCEFYTNLCYHFDSPCNKDVALRDRLLIYYPNITLCDTGCTNTGVNLTAMTAICECKYKELTDDDNDGEINLYKEAVNEVYNILNQVNLAVMECYQDLFDLNYFMSNTGGQILLVMILVQIITLMIYYYSSIFFIKKYIYSMTESYILYLNKSPLASTKIKNFNFKNNEKLDDNNSDNNKKNHKNKNYPPKKTPINENDKKKANKIHNNADKKTKNKDKNKKKVKTQEDFEEKNILSSKKINKIKKINNSNNKIKIYSKFPNNLEKSEVSFKSNKSPLIKKEKDKNNPNFTFEKYLSTEYIDMNFHLVVKSDKRLFFDYFCDKLKKRQVILELCYINSPFKPITIKILLLIFNIEICFVVNAMFINEDYVSEIFHSKKEETFISFLPRCVNRCIYTIFAYVVVNYFVGCLFVEERKIKNVFKREKNNFNNIKYQINLIMKEIKIKYNIFTIITIIFSIFSWYYISCFNNIYPHMKIEWIKSSVLIIILIHILYIVVILIETLLRFISFELKSEKLYKASIWLG